MSSLITDTKLLGIFANINGILDPYYKKRSSLFAKLIGSRIVDVLLYLPIRNIEKRCISQINSSIVDTNVCFRCTVAEVKNPEYRTKQPLKVVCQMNDKIVTIVMFGKKSAFYGVNEIIYVVGKITVDCFGNYVVVHPEKISKISTTLSAYSGFFCVYSLSAGVDQNSIRQLAHQALKVMHTDPIPDWHSNELLDRLKLPGVYDAFRMIHNPDSSIVNKSALHRLMFDEILAEQIVLERSRVANSDGILISGHKQQLDDFIASLPFDLTLSQKNAAQDIINEMSSGKAMIKLLQGDVGAGKTIVALLAVINVVLCGYQAAVLVPSEILAKQHYETIQKYCSQYFGFSVVLLTSSTKRKKNIIDKIAAGEVNIIVGTHAMIQEDVTFAGLGLIVIDEQHKFGVAQRLALINKGNNPHILSMSATPIPRTIVAALYGNISTSVLSDKPSNRRNIITTSLSIQKISNLLQSLQNVIDKGELIYWVCPLIEDENDKNDKTCVMSRFEFLQEYFNDKVGLIHGRMPQKEKDDIFDKFRNGMLNILVTTTVIEVGVDVANATVVIVENAENFGLAQLHQLRGRVGRSDLQSYCILLHKNYMSESARKRIAIMKETHDGFKIAEEDLKLRGGGEVIGDRQSGKHRYKTFDVDTIEFDADVQNIFEEARLMARDIVARDAIHEYKTMIEIYNKYENECNNIANSL